MTRGRFARVAATSALACVAALALAAALGSQPVDFGAVLAGRGTEVDREILLGLRLPRVAAAALIGGALAVAGTAFQALLRNPLAEPYLLGLSGGGSFGAVLSIVVLGGQAAWGVGGRTGAALAGCLGAVALVYAVASRGGGLRPSTLLLAGVVVNAFFLAGIAAAQFAATPTEAQAILRWVLGGLAAPSPAELAVLAVLAPGGALLVAARAKSLNLLAFDEETARHLGVDVASLRREVFVTTSLLTAACVAVAGPIGFVGLFVPHAVRFAVGADHRLLVPASFFAGAGFLALADAAARTAMAPRELPVGIVTAAVGAPAFVAMLLRRRDFRETAA